MNTLYKYKSIVDFIRTIFKSDGVIPLQEPIILAKEQEYVLDALQKGNVASQGKYISLFEAEICEITKSKHAIAVSSGTSALHIALKVARVDVGDEVLTQSLSFVATANAISYCGASPHFVDVGIDTLGMSPTVLKSHLNEIAELRNGVCYNKNTDKRIAACVPMHTFGNPMCINEIVVICNEFGIPVVEDAAQALGSSYGSKQVGTFGVLGIFSFNGNKIVTSGGGGAVITDDAKLAEKVRFLINQAKEDHPWETIHSEIGFNYKMPNLNAALGLGQAERLTTIISDKKELHEKYQKLFEETDSIRLIAPIKGGVSNHWLQTILFDDSDERDNFLKFTNQNKIQTKAVWKPLHQLKMYLNCERSEMVNTEFVGSRLVCLPSNL